MLSFYLLIGPPIVLVIAGIAYGIQCSRLETGPSKARSKFIANTLFACAFISGGLIMAIQIAVSPRLVAEGYVQQLHQTGGKSSRSEFYVMQKDGGYVYLHADYEGPNLANGQNVRARYVSGLRTVTYLEVLEGPHTGWTRKEGDGTLTASMIVGFGVYILFLANKTRHNFPDGNDPPPPDTEPPSGVDEASLLHLN